MKKAAVIGLLVFALQLISVSGAKAYIPKSGDVIKVDASPAVFLVDDAGQRIPLSSQAFAIRYNNNFDLIRTVTEAEWGGYTTNFIINETQSRPNGSLIMYWQDPTIYLIENGYKRGFATWEAFSSRGYDVAQIHVVGQFELYPTGPLLK
jgi:hypothetical protein